MSELCTASLLPSLPMLNRSPNHEIFLRFAGVLRGRVECVAERVVKERTSRRASTMSVADLDDVREGNGKTCLE